jgi:hypothetical protein
MIPFAPLGDIKVSTTGLVVGTDEPAGNVTPSFLMQ